jgi:hypothetical protein
MFRHQEAAMPDTVDVTLAVEPAITAALEEAA